MQLPHANTCSYAWTKAVSIILLNFQQFVDNIRGSRDVNLNVRTSERHNSQLVRNQTHRCHDINRGSFPASSCRIKEICEQFTKVKVVAAEHECW